MATYDSKRLGIVFAFAAAATLGSVARDASACGDEWVPVMRPEIDYRTIKMPLAEKALDDGHYGAAAGYVIRMMPHVRSLAPSSAEVVLRGMRVLAVAVARTGGALPIADEVPYEWSQGSWRGATEAERAANLEWSIATLRKIGEARKDDTTVETDLAEALSKVASHRAEARDRLEALAKRDLVATPEAYGALAALRREAGDEAGQKLALARCEAMGSARAACGAAKG